MSQFSTPRCCECGLPLPSEAAGYRWTMRLYCAECKPVERIKDSWMPLAAGAVVRVAVYRKATAVPLKAAPSESESVPLAQQIKRIRVPS